jgi:excisionase family DNA binding protein
MAMPKSITTKEVARLCCVSDATVKRWEDAGLLKSERTSGGHRRFRVEEVARFQREQELGLKQCNGDESVISNAIRRRENKYYFDSELFNSLIAGSEEETSNILINAFLNDNSLEYIFDEIISPALKQIGELWFAGELTIAQEHIATRTVLCALHKLRNLVPVSEPNGKTAICCTVEGDFHELPAHFVQMILESQGFEVINFGANMPIYALYEEISQHSPKLVCISSTILADIERFTRDFRSFSDKLCKLNGTVILGGYAFQDSQIRRRFPADFYAENFTDLAGFTKNISRIV